MEGEKLKSEVEKQQHLRDELAMLKETLAQTVAVKDRRTLELETAIRESAPGNITDPSPSDGEEQGKADEPRIASGRWSSGSLRRAARSLGLQQYQWLGLAKQDLGRLVIVFLIAREKDTVRERDECPGDHPGHPRHGPGQGGGPVAGEGGEGGGSRRRMLTPKRTVGGTESSAPAATTALMARARGDPGRGKDQGEGGPGDCGPED